MESDDINSNRALTVVKVFLFVGQILKIVLFDGKKVMQLDS